MELDEFLAKSVEAAKKATAKKTSKNNQESDQLVSKAVGPAKKATVKKSPKKRPSPAKKAKEPENPMANPTPNMLELMKKKELRDSEKKKRARK